MFPSTATAYQSLTDYTKNRPSAQNVLTDAQNKYDIPGFTTRLSNLRGLVGNLTSSAEAVDPSVRGRTAGGFVTEGQNQALVNKERAPILSDLSKQQGALSTEQQGYDTANSLAGGMASAVLTQDQNTYQQLLDQYNAANARDVAAEQTRQFNVDQANKLKLGTGSGTGGVDLSSLFSGLSDTAPVATAGAKAVQRADKGFNYTDANGKAISAAQYAALKGIAFRDVLSAAAKAGDKGSATALGFVGNDFGYDPNKVNNQTLVSLYNALVGGTGRKATIYKAPTPATKRVVSTPFNSGSVGLPAFKTINGR